MNSDDYKAAAIKAGESIEGYVKTHVTVSLCAGCLVVGILIGLWLAH